MAGAIYTAAALGSAFAPTIETLCAARFVLGIAVGAASFAAPMYIFEHSLARLRGGMTAFNQFTITFGILVAYLADYALSRFSHNWRWMFGSGAEPGVCLARSPTFAGTPAQDVVLGADVRSVASVPGPGKDGNLFAMISTHRRKPGPWTRLRRLHLESVAAQTGLLLSR